MGGEVENRGKREGGKREDRWRVEENSGGGWEGRGGGYPGTADHKETGQCSVASPDTQGAHELGRLGWAGLGWLAV